MLPALLHGLSIAAPVLVGHSDGGSIALLYAARHEPRAIAIMAPHVFVEEITIEGIRDARAAWQGGKLQAPLARLHDDPDGAFFGWNDGWLDPAFRDWNIEAELPKIRCRVLAIQGVDDQYATMAQLDRIAAGLHLPCRLLKLASCGHTPQRDQPAAVSTAIAQLYENAANSSLKIKAAPAGAAFARRYPQRQWTPIATIARCAPNDWTAAEGCSSSQNM